MCRVDFRGFGVSIALVRVGLCGLFGFDFGFVVVLSIAFVLFCFVLMDSLRVCLWFAGFCLL